jgi:hypothetical protein
MFPRPAQSATLACWLFAAACATAPVPTALAEQRLDEAEAQIQGTEWDAGLATLETLAGDACPRHLRARRDLARSTAEQGRGELWRAFLAIEKFADDYPHSDLRSIVVERLWTIGSTLAASDRGFWFFWSDRRAGRTVLEHLITRHPDTQRLADALRILGDMAFEDQNYELAQQRFRDIMLNRPESEWFVYAQFRFAMSLVASLQGSDYDLARMEHATRELRDFLAVRAESPDLVQQAEEALRLVVHWQVLRHLTIADFYRTVGNAAGERRHVGIAAREEFRDSPEHPRAVERLGELDAQAAAPRTP